MINTPPTDLIDQNDDLERQNKKLRVIIDKLMRRVEQVCHDPGNEHFHFEHAITLEDQVRHRTHDLEEALDILNATNANLALAQRETEKARNNLVSAVESIPEGFAIFDAQDCLILKNEQFGIMFSDIYDQVRTGMHFSDYLKLCVRSEHMLLPDELSAKDWIDKRLEAHQEKSAHFSLALRDNHWLQINEQSTQEGGTIILQTDITDLVRLQYEERSRMLDQQGQIIKETLEHIAQGVLIFDHEGRLAEWNKPATRIVKIPATFFKKGTRVQRFKPLFQPGRIFTPQCHPERVGAWLNQKISRPILHDEVETLDAKQYEVFGQEMSNGSCLLSFTDITRLRTAHRNLHEAYETMEQKVRERTMELRTARDSAERANASKSRFVAAASHDLLQPLNAAKLFISSLAHSELSPKQHNVLDRATLSLQSVETILGALLDISKLDSGKAALNVGDFELDTIFERLTEEFSPSISSKGLALRIVAPSIAVHSDPVYLRRILQNLISNAIRYTPQGKILIGARRREKYAELIVQDTGVGIAPDEQKLIFKEFHRVSSLPADDTAMGLGLAIVERACNMLNHHLILRSEPGRGTQFSIQVAYAKKSSEGQTNAVLSNVTKPSPTQNAVVMVIEDDRNVREGMNHLLQNWGMSPILVANSTEALTQLAEKNTMPDIFLVDFHLGKGISGLELIQHLRASYGPIRSILLTANHDRKLQKEAASFGVFLRHKPIDPNELHRLITRLLNSK